ncbi:MAG: DUF1874 domain-containing protein [Candidatus Lokiarchaeota archaeon]|nr:DUF1874 domain-containing protein [Candidatus Lokiarchaeota archaeon]
MLNAAILTDYGTYEFFEFDESKMTLDLSKAISAVGHESTAEILSVILNTPIKANRIQVKMKPSQIALVFRLKNRPPEGKILNIEEMLAEEHQMGILKRIK